MARLPPVTAASPQGLEYPAPPVGRPLIMGIINVTSDSFFPASRVPGAAEAVRAGLRMAEEGADILDVGGESTRPGSNPVAAEVEAERVVPVIAALAKKVRAPISVDTGKAQVAEMALGAGATMLNDVFALRGDQGMPAVAARYPTVVLMHMLGRPRTMQARPRYGDVVGDILDFLRRRLEAFESAGGERSKVWIDPGIGFGKTREHNVEILSRLEEFRALERPLLVGASRKSFIGRILGSEARPCAAELRLEGSLAVACRAAEAGARAVRVHDVAETKRILDVYARLRPQAAS